MNQISEALNQNYIENLFRNKKIIYFPGIENDIQNIKIEKISPDWAQDTCLARYEINFCGEVAKFIRGASGNQKIKQNAWEIMNLLWRLGFDQGNSRIARPLDFIKEASLLLYEEVKGIPFSQIIKFKNPDEIPADLKKIACWLAKLHKLKIPEENISKSLSLNFSDIQKTLSDIKNLIPSLKEILPNEESLANIEKAAKAEEKTLIHNDFYPGNIIFSQGDIFIIDFDKAGTGHPFCDVASLLASFEFPEAVWSLNLSSRQIKELQKIFLSAYCQQCNIDFSDAKKQLELFLAKSFFERFYDHIIFAQKGWPSFDPETKKNLEKKITQLAEKIKIHL